MSVQPLISERQTAAPGGTSRISQRFLELRSRGEKALLGFLTAGDPNLDATCRIALAMAHAGVDLIEIGIPFSDPLLDGPVIQAASQRALETGVKVAGIFEMVSELSRQITIPMIFMTCLNPIRRLGMQEFARQSREAGMDGVLVTDLPPEEGADWIAAARACDLDRIFMLAPTSSASRIRSVTEVASGFIYCQSRTGITGFQASVPPDLGPLIDRVRAESPLPIAVGFGISTPDHARVVGDMADGVAVGTAFVKLIADCGNDPDAAADAVGRLTADLKRATREV